MDFDTTTEAGQVAALTKAALAGAAQIVAGPDGRQFLVTPDGYSSSDITPLNGLKTLKPDTTRQQVTLQSLDSLGEYGRKFRTDTTTLFGDVDSNTIVAAIDYHGPTEAALIAHVATLKLPFSVEWSVWTAIDNKLMDQLEFARFIEENATDVLAPSGADLLEVVQDMQHVTRANFKGAVRTASDNVNFDYTEETDVGTRSGGVEVPKRFLLSIPVYFGDSPVELYANLRHRVQDGKLLLGVALHRKEHVRQAVFQQHLLTAADRIDCLAVFGKFTGRSA